MNLSRSSTRRTTALISLGAAAALALAGCGGSSSSSSGSGASGSSSGEKPIVGLITKTDTNPFFVKMKEGAQAAADSTGQSCNRSPASSTATTTPRWRRSRT